MDLQTQQLQILQEINATLTQQRELLTSIAGASGTQANAFREVTNSAGEAAGAVNTMTESMSAASSETEKATGMWGKFTEALKGFVGDKAWTSINDAVNPALALLGTNFESLADIISNPVQAAFGVLTSVYDVVIKKAAEMMQDMYRLADAFERVRAKVGSFSESSAARVKTMAKTMSGSLKEAAGGANVFASKFAPGIDGAIERVEKSMEIFDDLGSVVDALGSDFNRAQDELYLLKEGLAFSSEAMQQTARLAMLGGKSVKTFGQEILSSVDKIGRNFGISTKVLGKDVGAALNNFKILGKMTGDYVKQITQAAVFTRKLGIELTELTGLVDKFDDFEQGAEAAAQLAQGFGLVLDPLKMLNMQDPAARLQEVQRAFAATGRSVDSMSRQERALLASTSGLTEEQTLLALSSKGMAMSYDDIVAGADAANKKQKSTEETFRSLADNIENVIVPLEDVMGFMTAFFSGFAKGFMGNKGPQNLLAELARMLMTVGKIGGSVGKIFAEFLFPPDKGGKGGLSNIMLTIGTMFTDLAATVKTFAEDMKAGNVIDAVKKLLGGVFGSISTAFTGGTAGFSVGNLAAQFGQLLLDVLVAGVEWLAESIPRWITELDKLFTGSGDSTVTGGFSKSIKRLEAAVPALLAQMPNIAGALMKAILRMFETYPISTAIAGLFVGGGPIMTTLTSIAGSFFNETGRVFDTVGAAVGSGAATGAAGGAAAGVAAGLESGVGKPVEKVLTASTGIMSRLFDIVQKPAEMALMATAIASSIKTIGLAIREVLLAFMQPLKEGSPVTFIDFVAEAAGKLEAVTFNNLFALGGVMLAAGGAIGAVMYGMGMLYEKVGVGGMLAIAAASALAGAAGAGTTAKGLLSEVLGMIGSVLSQLVAPFSDDTFITNLKKSSEMSGDINALKGTSTALKGIIEAITAIDAAVPKGFLGPDPDELFSAVSISIDLLAGKDGKDGLISELGRIPDATAAVARAESIKKLGETMGTISSIMTTLVGMPDLSDATAKINSLVDKGTEGFIPTLGKLSSQITGTTGIVDTGTAKGALTGLSDSITAIGTIITSLTGMTGVPRASQTMQRLTATEGFMASLGAFGTSFNTVLAPGTVTDGAAASAKNLAGGVASLNEIVTSLNSTGEVMTASDKLTALTAPDGEKPLGFIERLGDLALGLNTFFSPDFAIGSQITANIRQMARAVKEIEPLNEALNDISGISGNIENVITGLGEDRMTQFQERLTALVEHTSMINDILSDLETVRLDATIENLESNMRLAKTSMKIAGGAVNVNVQLNVTMDAQKISESLIMNGYVVATDDFTKFMQLNDGVNDTFKSDDNIGYTGVAGSATRPQPPSPSR